MCVRGFSYGIFACAILNYSRGKVNIHRPTKTPLKYGIPYYIHAIQLYIVYDGATRIISE